jgi:hypothetical protein
MDTDDKTFGGARLCAQDQPQQLQLRSGWVFDQSLAP